MIDDEWLKNSQRLVDNASLLVIAARSWSAGLSIGLCKNIVMSSSTSARFTTLGVDKLCAVREEHNI